MTPEHSNQPIPNQDEEFGFTQREQLNNRVNDTRFRAFWTIPKPPFTVSKRPRMIMGNSCSLP